MTLDQVIEAIAVRVVERLAELQLAQTETRGEQSPWMNIETAAAYLDLPKQRLYKLTAANAIPHYKQDGRLLFNRGELDAWLAGFACNGDWISAPKRAISP